MADGVKEAQAGHVKLSYALQEKMLTFHKSKSIYQVYGSKKYRDEVKQQIAEFPMTLGEIHLKRSQQQKYLGDILDERGLDASVRATVKAREGKTKAGIYELRSVCQDFRLQLLGGMVGAIALWESCIVSSLLTNCGTWMMIQEDTIKKLNDLQNLCILVLLKMPHSTPRLATRALSGLLGMKWRIWKQKISLVGAIKKLEDNTLAKEVFNDQLEYELPGLVQEVKKICREICIPDVTENEVTKEEIHDAIEIHHLKYLKEEMGDKEKYKEMKKEDLRKPQTFMKEMNLEQCAIAMRIKCYMINCAGNMRAHYRGREECVKCRPGQGVLGPGLRETQGHLEICEGYKSLRVGKDLEVFKDKVLYFQELLKEREKTIKRSRRTT